MLFADYFLQRSNEALNKKVLGFSDKVLNTFEHYHWPGNLRELQNVIKRAVLLTEDDYIDVGNLPKQVTEITVDRP
ncbi:MAG: sigma-54-dependent Fis family transcriptional regulator, partial [Pseudomonadota bacterium]